MAEKFTELNEKHIEFINKQSVYFTGTAAADGLINVSPKGMDSLKVINNTKVIWLNLTGSSNESAAHVIENNRMTIMFCSFDKKPLILRLYGNAKVVHQYDERWNELVELFPQYTGARQFFELDISLAQTSCGYGVPLMELKNERETLTKWADKRGQEGIEKYWEEKNTHSLDGKDTGIFESNDLSKK